MDNLLAERDKLRAEVERLRATDKEAKSAFAPWVQGPGIVGGILHLQEEVERLRAKADARAVEELTNLRNLIGGDANEGRSNGYNAACGNYVYLIGARIAELSKPAAKESEPAQDVPKCGKVVAYINGEPALCDAAKGHAWACSASILEPRPIEKPEEPVKLDGLVIGGVKVTKDNLKCFFDEPEEPDWTVTLAAQAKNSYARTDEPVEESTARLLVMVVEGLCRLGREMRRGGKS